MCPTNGHFTDPAGDATGVLGVGTPLPNATGLDVVSAAFSSPDPATDDVTLTWQVTDLPEVPGGVEGSGEYFDANFSLGGGSYYLQATRSLEDGESFRLGTLGTTRTTLASDLAGSFDAVNDEISVTLTSALWTQLALPGAVAVGQEISGVTIVARRSLVLLVPDADTATSTCGYTIGAERPKPNTAPEITSLDIRSHKGKDVSKAKTGDVLTFSATAVDAENDVLTYTWEFGDGSTLTGALVEHTYLDPNDAYTVTLTVTDGRDGDVETTTLKVKGKSLS